MALDHLIVVDGYNLVLRSPQLRPGSDRTLAEARARLVNLLSWAVGAGDAKFLVVFDGADIASREEGTGRVEVRYSKPPKKADDLIREIVEDRIERVEKLTVVTSDLEVARHARAMGANVAMGDLFMTSMLGSASEEESRGPEKPTTLSKKELEEWAEIFRTRAAKKDDSE